MAYHLLASNIFLNTAAEDARGLERWGDLFLTPIQYLLAAESACPLDDPDSPYLFQQRFDYTSHLFIKTTASVIALPLSVAVGIPLKGLSFLSAETRKRHQDLFFSRSGPLPPLSSDHYDAIGIDASHFIQPLQVDSLHYPRRPTDACCLKNERKALKQILDLLKNHRVLCWADCGTCLGAYRYGGVIPWDLDLDIAILQPDFAYVKRILKALPSQKYLVQDWSNRLHPQTLLKVYVRKTREHIDIYNFALNSKERTIHFILSHENNIFLSDAWKIREKRFTV
ncbi:MAG: LicD family protein, partial [Chlamydiales bacterium]|nr:LicD family protein [Chlamydiales bacterium]